jgi:uncharacterized membrane protein
VKSEGDLRERFLWVVQTMVVAAAVALALGLILHVSGADALLAERSLRTGLVILMSTPVIRILIAVAERLRTRDVQYLVVTAIVLMELSLTMWYAVRHV